MLWLISASIFFFATYHLLLNNFLVKWACKALLGDRVCFQEDLIATENGRDEKTKINGPEKGDIKSKTKILTKGDVAEISHWYIANIICITDLQTCS